MREFARGQVETRRSTAVRGGRREGENERVYGERNSGLAAASSIEFSGGEKEEQRIRERETQRQRERERQTQRGRRATKNGARSRET